MNTFDFCQVGKQTLQIELSAICELEKHINQDFNLACQRIMNASGKVVVMGIGKSGHIARKIAATFASTGTPAFFVHPAEASHGDLGMIEAKDIVIAISYSGEAPEVVALLPVIKRRGITLIAMTSSPTSTMGRCADIHLSIAVAKEACPIGLAPTSSTTATLVMGDALAVAIMQARGFTSDDFALSHPGGALGRKLLLKLGDVMHSGHELPKVTPTCSVRDALLEISAKGLGMTAIVDNEGDLLGIFTDGDLRRVLDAKIDIHTTPIGKVMGHHPTTASANLLAAQGLKLMEDKKINGLLITEGKKLVGALNMHDLLKTGVM